MGVAMKQKSCSIVRNVYNGLRLVERFGFPCCLLGEVERARTDDVLGDCLDVGMVFGERIHECLGRPSLFRSSRLPCFVCGWVTSFTEDFFAATQNSSFKVPGTYSIVHSFRRHIMQNFTSTLRFLTPQRALYEAIEALNIEIVEKGYIRSIVH